MRKPEAPGPLELRPMKIPASLQNVLAQAQQSRWVRAALVGVTLVAVALAIWIGTRRYFSYEPKPEFAQYGARVEDPVLLGDMFASYETMEATTEKLLGRGFTIDRSASHKPASRRYPPRDLDSMEIIGYDHLGQRGHLRIEFFNNRLYEVHFEPDDTKDYVRRLHEAEPALKRDRVGMADATVGTRRIVSNVDLANSKVGRELNTTPYVIWQELRLKQQLAQWEELYGADALRNGP
jgi:hypothetical protein